MVLAEVPIHIWTPMAKDTPSATQPESMDLLQLETVSLKRSPQLCLWLLSLNTSLFPSTILLSTAHLNSNNLNTGPSPSTNHNLNPNPNLSLSTNPNPNISHSLNLSLNTSLNHSLNTGHSPTMTLTPLLQPLTDSTHQANCL
ncbi:hypothetical protein YQE_02420, partial [Dendroctonus ponderosae]